MNQKERRAARGLQIVAVCCCFCLLAVGAGVTYRAMDREKAGGGETLQKEQPVTAVQSKTIEIAQAEQQGEAEKTKEIKETKETKAQPARKSDSLCLQRRWRGKRRWFWRTVQTMPFMTRHWSSIARTHLSAFPRRRGQR